MVLVKICGLTRAEQAAAAIAAGADMVGFVFVPGTPRAVDPGDLGWVRELAGTATVGVFRNAALDQIQHLRAQLELDWVQLHGQEPDSYLAELGPRVLRWVPMSGAVDWGRVAALQGRCIPLLDPGAGAGVVGDWDQLGDRPDLCFGLAGGLDPENVADAVARVRPYLVDVSSGVEESPGIKDPAKVAAFVAAARRSATGRQSH